MNRFLVAIILVVSFAGCSQAEWAGRYKSENCMTLEYVEFYQDKTADIKYFGASYPTNHKMSRKGNHFYVNIYKFELREDGKMYEEGGYDVGCVLVKDKSHGFWERVFQP
jgi:hypothetical protein